MRISLRQTFIVTTALIGFGGFAAGAATPPAAAPAAAPAAQTQAAMPQHRMAGRVEARIKDLHAKLKITAEQQKLWDDFANVMRDNALRMDDTFQGRVQAMSTMTADQSMASYAKMAAQHAQDMQNLVPVFDALYASMSETQKRTADQVFRAEAHHGESKRHG
jgi:hypothetical protein